MATTAKGSGAVGKVSLLKVKNLLLAHPPLSQAVSEALDRNAANLKVKDLTPRSLEQLRHAQGIDETLNDKAQGRPSLGFVG